MEIEKVYFDVNIVLDIIDSKRVNHLKSKKLWELLTINKFTIIISEDILSIVFYINKDDEYTLTFFELIRTRWEIVPFGKEVIKNAIELSRQKNLDLEDILQCLCAKENGCYAFITEDKKFYDCGVKIMTSEEFILQMKSHYSDR